MTTRHSTHGYEGGTPPPEERHPTMAEVELRILERCSLCQQPGGPMNTLIAKVEHIGETVTAAFKILDERRGRQQVWSIIRAVLIPVFCVVLAWWLTADANRRNTIMLKRQADIAAEAARQIKAVGDKSAEDVQRLGKELEQGGRGR